MGIPWRSAESMHWQLGEQEMSARANAPVFQLHPSATGLNSPPNASVVPVQVPGQQQQQQPPPPLPQAQAPISHGFTPTNAPQLMPHPAGPPQSHPHHAPPPPSQGPIHSYHQRSDSGSSQGRGRSGSLGRRRARNSVPPHLGPTLPQIHPQSEADLISGARTAPAPDTQSSATRDGGEGPLGEPFGKRKREEEGLRADVDARSVDGRSPDRASMRSGTGSVKSVKRELVDSPGTTPAEPPTSKT